jgi:hypothetical protein
VAKVTGQFAGKINMSKAELKQFANRIAARLKAFHIRSNQVASNINTTFIDDVETLKRKSRGIELANERCAKLERQLAEIIARLDGQGGTTTSNTTTEVDAKLANDLQVLDGLVGELWDNLQAQIDQLRTDLTEVQRVQGEHTGQLADHDTRLTVVEAVASGLHEHVSTLEGSEVTETQSTPWSVPIAGLFAGAAGAAFWWYLGNIGQLQQWIEQLNVTFIYEPARGPIGITIAGLGVFALVTGLLGLFVPKTITRTIRRREVDHHSTTPIPQPPHPAVAGETPPWAAGSPEVPDRKEVVAS